MTQYIADEAHFKEVIERVPKVKAYSPHSINFQINGTCQRAFYLKTDAKRSRQH